MAEIFEWLFWLGVLGVGMKERVQKGRGFRFIAPLIEGKVLRLVVESCCTRHKGKVVRFVEREWCATKLGCAFGMSGSSLI